MSSRVRCFNKEPFNALRLVCREPMRFIGMRLNCRSHRQTVGSALDLTNQRFSGSSNPVVSIDVAVALHSRCGGIADLGRFSFGHSPQTLAESILGTVQASSEAWSRYGPKVEYRSLPSKEPIPCEHESFFPLRRCSSS